LDVTQNRFSLDGDDSRLETVRDNLSKEEYREICDTMSPAEKKRVRAQLEAKRDLQSHGIRKTDKSLAMDVLGTANSIEDQVSTFLAHY
jgi:hypothetical protein